MDAHPEGERTHVFDSTVTRDDIVQNWLPRYTGVPLEDFGRYILLTNFQRVFEAFLELAPGTDTWDRLRNAERDGKRDHHHQFPNG